MALLRHRRTIGPSSFFISTPVSLGSGETAEFQQFLDRVSAPDTTHKNAYRALINGLVTDSVWAATDCLYILAAVDTGTAQINLKQSSFALTSVNAPAFSADHGYTGNGSIVSGLTSYLETSFTPSTAGGNHVQNSAGLMYYGLTEVTHDGNVRSAIGGEYNTLSHLSPVDSGNIANACVNTFGADVTASNATSIATMVITRTGSTASALYQNGNSTAIATNAVASNGLVNGSLAICGVGLGSGTATEGYDGQIAAAWIGGGLDGTQAAALMNRVNTYMTALGINIY